jgi:hypothetical protein
MHKQPGAQSAHAVGAAEAELDRSHNVIVLEAGQY